VVVHFREPFLAYVFEGGGRCDGEAYEEDISLRVGEGSKSVVILLSGSIEETKGIWLVTNPLLQSTTAHVAVASIRRSCSIKPAGRWR
jgi:hypothetical protein